MQARKLQLANKTLLNAKAPQWQRCDVVALRLRGTEAHLQPTSYVRTVWAGKHIGAVRSLSVAAAYNRENIFFRLEWPDDTQNADYAGGCSFPDAAAVLFTTAAASAPLPTMGSQDQPIDAWYWRANHPDSGERLCFQGLATEEPQPNHPVLASSVWHDSRWQVVIGAPVTSVGESVAFAVWEGGNQERAGLHSYSPAWQELSLQ